MKQKLTKLKAAFSTMKRINVFYILTFAPLLIIFYYSPFTAVIPFYGFLLLLIKGEKLPEFKEASFIQKIVGMMAMAGSFFVYYAVILVYPEAAFYGPANYAVYLFGLFLLFFKFPALREAFAPLFLIVAASSSEFISIWLEPFLSPFANDFAHVIVGVLRTLGVNASIYSSGSIPIVALMSLSGTAIVSAFVYGCIGVYSALVFSIILVVVLLEDPSGIRVQLLWSVVGVLGTFALNILRVTIIFLTDYFYGAEVGATVHYVIGYALFSIWLVFFLFAYSKRRALQMKSRSLWHFLKGFRH